jgi:hypothetical protein
MAGSAENEGFRVLDDFVCNAILAPQVPPADPKKHGKNEGLRIVEELVIEARGDTAAKANADDQTCNGMLTDQQRQRLEGATRIGKTILHKDKDGGGYRRMGIVEDEVYIIVNDYKHVIQKIKIECGTYWDGSQYAYRTGYYTYDAKRKRIVWGQYTQFLTEQEYKKLLSKARAKGWAIF